MSLAFYSRCLWEFLYSIPFCFTQNGMEATSALRSGGFDRLIIGATGCAMADEVAAFINAGADLVVGKPIRMHTVEKLLGHVRTSGTGSSRDMKLGEVDGKMCWVQR